MTGRQRVNLSTGSTRNLSALFDEAFEEAGDRLAFRSPQGDVLLTYAALRDGVARYANALMALGIEPGDRVTVQVEKSLPGVMLYLATMRSGAVYQPLNPAYTLAEVDYFAADAEPKIIVCDPGRQAEMRAIADRRGVHAVVNLDRHGQGSLAALAARMKTYHVAAERGADDLAGLIYTSGTTGRSKGAMLTHGNLASNALTLHRVWHFEPGDVLIHALPIFHVHGLYVALGTAFLNRSEIVWFDRFDADAVIGALPRATVLMGVPTFYTRLLASPRLTANACRGMRLFVSGSAPLLAETHKEFAERARHLILERYGMTETGMITSNPYDGERTAGTVGFALPEVGVRIADSEGRELRRGEIGTIEVRGPNVFKGYWRMPDKTARDFRADGYFITGDVGTMDEAGRVSILGRAKDVIISGGFNIYPKEIEDELDEIEGVVESAVIGVPHPDWGESVVAVVIGKGALPAEAEIIARLAGRLAKFKLPKRIVLAGELPRNAMGKVQKSELRKAYADTFTQFTQAAAPPPPRR
jgi:malonyl-CoA/methylmalonyl-CoA synthetase